MSWLNGTYIGFDFLHCVKCEDANVYDLPGFKEHYATVHLDGFIKGSCEVCKLSFGLDDVFISRPGIQSNGEHRGAQSCHCQPEQSTAAHKQLREKYGQLETALTVALVRAMQESNATMSRDKMKSLVERLRGCPEWSAVFQQPLLSSGETGQCCIGSAVDHADLGTKQPKLEPGTPTAPEVGGGVERERILAVDEQPVRMTKDREQSVDISQTAVHQEGGLSGTLSSAEVPANHMKVEQDAPEYVFVRSNEEVQYGDSHSTASIPPPASPDPEPSSQKSAEMESSVEANLRPPKQENEVVDSDSDSTYSIPPPASPDPEPETSSPNSLDMQTSMTAGCLDMNKDGDSDIEIVAVLPKVEPQVTDLTENHVSQKRVPDKRNLPGNFTKQTANKILPAHHLHLPFGLVDLESSVQITNFASCSSAIKREEVDQSSDEGQQFFGLVNFLDEFMTKTGLSFTIHLGGRGSTLVLVKKNSFMAQVTCDQLPDLAVQASWPIKASKKPSYAAEYAILRTLLQYIGSRTRIDENEVIWTKLACHKEATRVAVNYLSGVMKILAETTDKEQARRGIAQYTQLHRRAFLGHLHSVAPYHRLSRRERMTGGRLSQVSIAAVESGTMPNKGKRAMERAPFHEPDGRVPAAKLARSLTPLPFGISSFCAAGNVRHRFRRLPFNESELHVMNMHAPVYAAGIMRKQFVNRLLAKAENDIILEQFSESTSSSWGYTIRLNGVPDAMFYVSYTLTSTDCSWRVEDGIVQFILGRLSSRNPSFIPSMAGSAVYTNQRSADHLATYVAVALKYVRAQQGLSSNGHTMDEEQIAENLNDCLTEYWRVNLTALSAHLASSLHDNSIVSLPSE